MKHLFSVLAFAVTLFTFINAIDANAAWRPNFGGGNNGPGWSQPGRPGPGGPGGPGRPGPGGPGWGGPGHGGGRPNVTCTANDNGWEEHWGGHGSCGECLSKHGDCTERCSSISYACKADGTNNAGQPETFEAYGYDEFSARNDALNRCYQMGSRNCRATTCTQSSQLVSSSQCRR